MKMKRTISVLSALVMMGVCVMPSYAAPKENNKIEGMPSIEEQMADFEKYEQGLKTRAIQTMPDKEQEGEVPTTRATTGSYPTRKGTILVTDGLRVDSLLGHAGVVLKSGQTIESFPSGGVQYKYDNWTSRYKKVWGVTTSGTSTTQDASAADWAVSQRGKNYNYAFNDIENTSKFYCSQLVYKAFKTKTGVNLNYGGGVVTPADLVNSSNSYNIYTYAK